MFFEPLLFLALLSVMTFDLVTGTRVIPQSASMQPTVVTTAIYPDRVCVVLVTSDAQLITKCTSTTTSSK